MNDFDIIDMIDSVDDISILSELGDMLPDDMAHLATDKIEKNGTKI